MTPRETDEKCELAVKNYDAGRYIETLNVLEELDEALPNAIWVGRMRVQTLMGLGLSEDAGAECKRVTNRIQEARNDCRTMSEMLGELHGW